MTVSIGNPTAAATNGDDLVAQTSDAHLCPGEDEMYDFLSAAKLAHYFAPLKNMGYAEVEDLYFLRESEISAPGVAAGAPVAAGALGPCLGMKRPEALRLKRYLEQRRQRRSLCAGPIPLGVVVAGPDPALAEDVADLSAYKEKEARELKRARASRAGAETKDG
jgi:hypothetical protein